jgi:biotin operon repressor
MAVAGRLERLIELTRTGAYSSPALAKKLGVSEQTIYRDILYLKQNGHTIHATKHSSGWAYVLTSEAGPVESEEGGFGT